MDMHELHRLRMHKDHEMRHGHLSREDRDMTNPVRYGFLDSEDKQYHSPETPQTMEGEY